MVTTRIDVERRAGRPFCVIRNGPLSARRLREDGPVIRIALVATVALLLAGDDVDIEVRVGPGVDLDVVESAGTVAYDMRGGSASWRVRAEVGAGSTLRWNGLPMVVAGGADVERSTHVDLADGAAVLLREPLVFGRDGEAGGRLGLHTTVVREGRPELVEELDLSPAARSDFAVLGGLRCLDTLTLLGARLPTDPGDREALLQLEAVGTVARAVTEAHHLSGLDRYHALATAAIRGRNAAVLRSRDDTMRV